MRYVDADDASPTPACRQLTTDLTGAARRYVTGLMQDTRRQRNAISHGLRFSRHFRVGHRDYNYIWPPDFSTDEHAQAPPHSRSIPATFDRRLELPH